LGISAIGVLALLLLLTWEVLGPLRDLARMAARLALGDLKARARIRGGTELQLLAAALNDAAERLGQTQEDLEAAVAARTSELSRANARLAEVNASLERLALTDPLTGLMNRR